RRTARHTHVQTSKTDQTAIQRDSASHWLLSESATVNDYKLRQAIGISPHGHIAVYQQSHQQTVDSSTTQQTHTTVEEQVESVSDQQLAYGSSEESELARKPLIDFRWLIAALLLTGIVLFWQKWRR